MKVSKAIAVAVAFSFASSGVAFAQGDGDQQAQQRNLRQLQRRAGPSDAQRRLDRQGQRAAPQARHFDNQPREQWGAGPDRQWRRGDRLPPQYRGRNYVVDDWRGHHLSAPPRGYQWVQNGNDYVLVAIATGIIAQLLLGNR
ncbi:MAG: RcnB family protein [Pseudomonadota bacterium]